MWSTQFLFTLQKFREFLKIYSFELRIAVNWQSFQIWKSSFFANIPNFVVEKDSEMKIGCNRGSGGDFFFFEFWIFFEGQKLGFPKNFQLYETYYRSARVWFTHKFRTILNDCLLYRTIFSFYLIASWFILVHLVLSHSILFYLGILSWSVLIYLISDYLSLS